MRDFDTELLVDFAKRQVVDLVIDDDAERAVGVVLADEDHAFLEALVRHGGGGDQEAADQRGSSGAGLGHDAMILQIHGDCPVKGQVGGGQMDKKGTPVLGSAGQQQE